LLGGLLVPAEDQPPRGFRSLRAHSLDEVRIGIGGHLDRGVPRFRRARLSREPREAAFTNPSFGTDNLAAVTDLTVVTDAVYRGGRIASERGDLHGHGRRGSYFLLLTSATAHDFSACAGASRTSARWTHFFLADGLAGTETQPPESIARWRHQQERTIRPDGQVGA
jgi:hypothetical protein